MRGNAELLAVLTLIAGILAALAPLILSLAARNAYSAVISLILIVAAVAVGLSGPLIIGQVLAVMLYLAALISASVIYAGSRIEDKTEDAAKRIVAEIEYLNNCLTTPAQPAQE